MDFKYKEHGRQIEIPLSPGARIALSRLEEKGEEAYVVGGAIRDALLGKSPKDFDIATSAGIERIREIFSPYKEIHQNGERHGTITLRIEGENIEISTFRGDFRGKPTLESDLNGRDLTMNSLAYEDGWLFDLVGGERDIEEKRIVFNSPKERRIQEDPCRILRALRIKAEYGFEIEEESKKAILENASLLNQVAKERVNHELSAIFLSQNIDFLLYEYKPVLLAIFPILKRMDGFDQQNPHHANDLLTHTFHVLSPIKNDLPLRVAALFHDIGKLKTKQIASKDGVEIAHYYFHPLVSAKLAKEILTEQRWLISDLDLILFYIENHDAMIAPKRASVGKMLALIASSVKEDPYLVFENLLQLQQADHDDHLNRRPLEREELLSIAKKMKEEGVAISIKELNISGSDLSSIGYIGEEIGWAKRTLLKAVCEGRLDNKRDLLLLEAKNLYKSRKKY